MLPCLALPFVLPVTIPLLNVSVSGAPFIVSLTNYLQVSLQPVFPWVLLPSSLSQSSHILLGLSGLIILKQVRMFPTICCFMHPDSSRVKILAEFQFILCSRFYLVEGILLHRSFFHPSFIRIT